MKTVFVLSALVLMTSGCATSAQKHAVDSSASKTFSLSKTMTPGLSAMQLAEVDREKLEKALADVLQFCQPRLSGFEAASASQAKKAFWLSMSGLVAGSVIGPALTAANATANATWTSALSGWAGATNFAGQALKTSGLSGATIAETRNKIISNVSAQIAVAADGTKSFDERKDALMKARADCTLYEIAVPSIPATE